MDFLKYDMSVMYMRNENHILCEKNDGRSVDFFEKYRLIVKKMMKKYVDILNGIDLL